MGRNEERKRGMGGRRKEKERTRARGQERKREDLCFLASFPERYTLLDKRPDETPPLHPPPSSSCSSSSSLNYTLSAKPALALSHRRSEREREREREQERRNERTKGVSGDARGRRGGGSLRFLPKAVIPAGLNPGFIAALLITAARPGPLPPGPLGRYPRARAALPRS